MSLLFHIWVSLDGQEYPCRLQADFVGHERILGRDVMNRLETLFRGPSSEVVVNPLRWVFFHGGSAMQSSFTLAHSDSRSAAD